MSPFVPEPWLPLSWGMHHALQTPRVQRVRLGFSRQHWLSMATLPAHWDPEALARWLKPPFVLRGCHPRLLQLLQRDFGGETLLHGREALLDLRLPHLERPALRQLIRRGLRHGQVHELALSALQQHPDIPRFLAAVQQRQGVTLQHLYRHTLPQSQRFWCFEAGHQLLGLLSLTASSAGAWHTELLLRDARAPVGVMEALIAQVFATLQTEQQRYLSLGEVPFFPTAPARHWQTRCFNGIGRGIAFAYDSEGLYRFKQKFRPLWRPVLLYGTPNLRPLHLLELFWHSRSARLIWQQRAAAYADLLR
ncbi:MAG: DUF2156 domain-containing protein [Candidatus Sericytochromatia bacterium]|nr:DUF2156 domain-containing protein [Candidatus Sericytochromatia bacterium]